MAAVQTLVWPLRFQPRERFSPAAEMAGGGIRVNALSPGLVLTDFQAKMGLGEDGLEQFEQYFSQVTPLGRPGRPEEIAAAALFLAGDDSAYVTGSDLTVNGGFMNV